MSLYGTGRREGILAVVVMTLIIVFVHAIAEARAGVWPSDWQGPAEQAGLAAVGGALFYRFLRSLDRSRFAAFLAGTAYALAPWFAAIAVLPREQAAAALAPLALEVATRAVRPDQSRRWLPWAGLFIAIPFAAGVTTVACFAALLATVQLVRAIVEVEAEDRPARAVGVFAAVVTGAAAATSLVWLDLGAPWFGLSLAPSTIEVLAAHRAPSLGLDVAAFVRLPGPVLLLFALLGLMRWQRRASNVGWLMIALVGAVPMLLLTFWPAFAELRSSSPQLTTIAAAGWWTALLATTVLGAAGLDDFLELPLRRPFALRLLLMIALVSAPALLFDARAPGQEWPLIVAFVAIAALLAMWRRLGILQFKNVLAVIAVLALAAPALQTLAVTERLDIDVLPARPVTEVDPIAAFERQGWLYVASRPHWYYSGLVGALAWSLIAAVMPRRRRTNPSPAPSSASTPIA